MIRLRELDFREAVEQHFPSGYERRDVLVARSGGMWGIDFNDGLILRVEVQIST
jgi:hypothetical protein